MADDARDVVPLGLPYPCPSCGGDGGKEIVDCKGRRHWQDCRSCQGRGGIDIHEHLYWTEDVYAFNDRDW